jgi:hypothetical protein
MGRAMPCEALGRLSGDLGDGFETLVEVYDGEPGELCRGGDDEVTDRGCTMAPQVGEQHLGLRRHDPRSQEFDTRPALMRGVTDARQRVDRDSISPSIRPPPLRPESYPGHPYPGYRRLASPLPRPGNRLPNRRVTGVRAVRLKQLRSPRRRGGGRRPEPTGWHLAAMPLPR